jgi:multiple sugar transport system substrate-binding protein
MKKSLIVLLTLALAFTVLLSACSTSTQEDTNAEVTKANEAATAAQAEAEAAKAEVEKAAADKAAAEKALAEAKTEADKLAAEKAAAEAAALEKAAADKAAAAAAAKAASEVKGKLVVWTWDGHMTKDVANFKKKYPNVQLDVQVLPGFFTKIKQALTTGVGLPDVIMVESGQYGEFAQNSKFEDLLQPPYNAGELKSQFMEFWWNNGLSLNGELRVFPRAPGMGAAFYRRDVAKKAFGTDDPAALEKLLPNLQAVIANAKAFKEKVGPNSSITTGADAIFSLALKQQGKALYDAKTETFDANRLKEPFNLAAQAIAAGIKPTSAAFWDDMKAGNYLYHTDGSWGEAYTIKAGLGNDASGKPNQNGLWGVMSTPGGNVNVGGNGLAILSTSKNKTAAWAFVKTLALDVDVAVTYMKEVAVYPALIAAQKSAFFNEPDEFFGGQKSRLKYGELAKTTVQIPVTPYDTAIQNIINKYVGSVLEGKMTADEAIKTIAAEVKKEVGIETLPK